MNFLIMPDSFKESLSAQEVAQIIKRGMSKVLPDSNFQLLPVGDGGEGSLEALKSSLEVKEKYHDVVGWNGKRILIKYIEFDGCVFFEMADIVGLQMVPREKRNPLKMSTFGIGELILYLQNKNIKKIYIGIGGSASLDGGIGLAAGLGYRFYDENHKLLEPIGENLHLVEEIDTSCVQEITSKIYAVNDVENILCGMTGATYVFGPQKGLANSALENIDKSMQHFYKIANPEIFSLVGGGAGGGVAVGLVTFASGEIISGIDFILDVLKFEQHAEKADMIIVGEGKLDSQSLSGKAPIGIARRAPKGVPVIGICGSVSGNSIDFSDYGITSVFPIIGEPGDLTFVLENAVHNLERTAVNIAHLIKSLERA